MWKRSELAPRGTLAAVIGVVSLASLASCSNILGLGDFHPADEAGGSGGTGASAGYGGAGAQGGAGGSAGTAATAGSAGVGATGGAAGGGPECTAGITEDCYSGPTKTENVGTCTGGRRVCGQDSRWGTCDGEVVPSVEDCGDSTRDENCDKFECGIWGFTYSQGAGTPGSAVGRPDGGVVFGGVFSGGLQLPGFTQLAVDDFDAYVAAFGPNGDLEWVHVIGYSGTDTVWAVTLGDNGDVYASVSTSVAADFGDGNRPVGTSVLRLSPTGEFRSSVSLGAAGVFGVRSVGEHLYLAGFFSSPIDWGTGTKTPTKDDIVVAKLGLDGEVVADGWVNTYGSAEGDGAFALDVDAAGNVLFGGNIGEAVDFGAGPVFHYGDADGYVVRLDPTGALVNSATLGSFTGSETVMSVGFDQTGSAIVVGNYTADLTVKGKTLTAVGPSSTFVVRYAWEGNDFAAKWGVGFPETSPDGWGRTLIDQAGRIGLVLTASGPLTLGAEQVPATANGLPGVVRLDGNGDHVWHRFLGTDTGGGVTGRAQGPNGEMFLLGTTNAPSLDIGTGVIAAGQGKSFVLKLGR